MKKIDKFNVSYQRRTIPVIWHKSCLRSYIHRNHWCRHKQRCLQVYICLCLVKRTHFYLKKIHKQWSTIYIKKVNIEFNIKTVDTGEKTTLCSAEFHPYKFQILQIIRICHAKKGKGFSKPINYFIHMITYQHKFCWYYPVPFQLDRNTCRPCWLVHTYDYIHDCRHTWIWLIWKNKIFDFDNSKLFNSYWEFSFTGIRNLKLNAM